MKLRIIKKNNKLLDSVYKYHEYFQNSRKLILVLANEYEFLDLYNTIHYFYRNPIKNYDIDPEISNHDLKLVKYKIIPAIKGFELNYIGNTSISLISILDKLPGNKSVGIIKMIGPGEINNNNLVAYEYIEYILNNYCNCETFSYWYYIDWYSKSKYNNFIHKYPGKLIDKTFNEKQEKDVVFVTSIVNYFKKSFKYNEIYSLPARLFLIVSGLKILKKGGTLYLQYFYTCYAANIQLLYKLSTLFESYDFINTKFQSDMGYYIFTNYKGNDHKLDDILIEYMKLDDTLGERSVLNRDLDDNILFDFDIIIENKFFEFIKKIHKNNIEYLQKRIEKCNYIKSQIKKNNRFIDKVIQSNIEIAINFANKNKLKLNSYYNNYFHKLTTVEYKKILFPKANIDYNKLKMTYESTYSVTFPEDADTISKIIKKKYPNAKSIVDMTANVGGNTLSFCKYFNYVYSIEIDKETSDYLKNNLELYKFKNYEVFNMDSQHFNKSADFYFYDPPWTGIFYKMKTNMSLYLGNKNIVDIMKPNFCLKAPMNYNISELLEKFGNISIYKIKNYLVIINNP